MKKDSRNACLREMIPERRRWKEKKNVRKEREREKTCTKEKRRAHN